MRYPFEPPEFLPGDRVRLMPPSPEAPAPGPCGHTPLQMWECGGAIPGMEGTVARIEGSYPVSCAVCDAWFDTEGIVIRVPNFEPGVVSPWTLELVDAT